MAGIGSASQGGSGGGGSSTITSLVGISALGQVTSANSLPVVLASDQSAIPVTGTFYQATQPVSIAATVAVSNAGLTELAAAINASSQVDVNIAASGATVPVSGTFWQATQPVSATDLDIRDLTSASDSVAAVQSGTWNITNISGTVSLPTGAATAAKQPALGTAGTASADVITIQGIASMTPVQVSQATASNLNATVVGTGTFVAQIDGAALTSLQLIDDSIYTDGSGTVTKGVAILGQDGTNPQAIKTDTSGELQVDVLTMPTVTVTATNLDVQSGGADLATTTQAASIQTAVELIDDTVATLGTTTYTEAATKGLIIGAVRRDADTTLANTTNEVTPLQVDANGYLKVEIFDGGGSHTVDNNGTFVTQMDGAALTALQLIDNSVYVDDADWTADTSSHNLVGSVTQVVPTANTDGDTTPLISDGLRQLRVAALESDLATAGTAHVKKYYTNAGAVTDGIIWSPAAGKRWFLTHLSINVSAAATVTIEDDLAGGDSAVYKAEFAANSGVVLTFPEVPMFSGEDAADLLVTTSAGNVYITAVGYEI